MSLLDCPTAQLYYNTTLVQPNINYHLCCNNDWCRRSFLCEEATQCKHVTSRQQSTARRSKHEQLILMHPNVDTEVCLLLQRFTPTNQHWSSNMQLDLTSEKLLSTSTQPAAECCVHLREHNDKDKMKVMREGHAEFCSVKGICYKKTFQPSTVGTSEL